MASSFHDALFKSFIRFLRHRYNADVCIERIGSLKNGIKCQ